MKLGMAAVCAAGLSLAWGPRAAAEEPGGAYTIEVNGDSGLLVPTGEGEVCDSGICVSTNVATDADGIVSGSGLVELDGSVTGTIDLALAGRVSGTTAKPKLALALLAQGEADGVHVEGKGKLKCRLGSVPSMLDCTGKLKVCAFQLGKKLGCEKLPFATEVAFLRQPFALDLDLQTVLTGTVTGEASARIGAITIASYTAKGKYKASTDASNLVLKSVNAAKKTKVALKKVVLAAGAPTAGTAVFKLMGQKGSVALPSIAPAAAQCQEVMGWIFCGDPIDTAAMLLFLQSLGYTLPVIPAFDPYDPPAESHPPVPWGSFGDVNQDTAALFTDPNNPQMVIDGTILFGVLGATSRSR
jgi:hypothetical protein